MAALLLGLVGAALLGWSFVTTEADIVIVTGSAWESQQIRPNWEPFVALCVTGHLIVQTFTDPPGNSAVTGPCPPGAEHPVAVITRDSRRLFVAGWMVLVTSNLWQAWIMRRPRLLLG